MGGQQRRGQAQARFHPQAQPAEQLILLQGRAAYGDGPRRVAGGIGQVGRQQRALGPGRGFELLRRHTLQHGSALLQSGRVAQQGRQPRLVQQQHALAVAPARAIGFLVHQLRRPAHRGQRRGRLAAQRVQQGAAQLGLGVEVARLAEPADVLFHRAQQGVGFIGPAGPHFQEGLHGDGQHAQRRVAVLRMAQRAADVTLQRRHDGGQAEVAGHWRGLVPADGAVQPLDHVQLAVEARRHLIQRPAVQRLPHVGAQRAGQGLVVQRLGQQAVQHRIGGRQARGAAQRNGLVGQRQLPVRRVAMLRVTGGGAAHGVAHGVEVPDRPRAQPAQQLQARAVALHGGELFDHAQHRRDHAAGDQGRALGAQPRAGLFDRAGAQQVADAAHGVLLDGRGALQQRRHLVRQLAQQPVFEEVAEQVVQPQRQLGAFQAGDEQPALLDLLQPVRGVRVLRHLPAALRVQLGQHRTAQHEAAQPGRHVLQHLGRQVVEDMPVERGRAQRAGGGAPVGQGVQRQAQAHRPALRACQQLRCRDALRGTGRGLQQRLDLDSVELQVDLAKLGQFALHTQPRQRQRRRLAAGQHQHPVRRQARQQQVDELEHAGILDAVQVVEHDDAARRLAGGQHVEQFVGGLAALCS